MSKVLKMRRPLECSACGAIADTACGCGAPYVPAGQRAVAAIKANPCKSNRAIAHEIGVDEGTVRKARKSTTEHSAVRLGKDGKVRRLPTRQEPAATGPSSATRQFTAAALELVLLTATAKPGQFVGTTAKADDLKTLAGFLMAVADLRNARKVA